ncbi:MAG: putative YcjX-like family ATPase [Methylophagaceae bacterium]
MFNNLASKLKTLTTDIRDSADSLFDDAGRVFDRAFDKHTCIGVTGFSASGKSTFITSLIHQLRYSNEAGLASFLAARDQRILEVNLLSSQGYELFDYQAGITALSSKPPQWPQPTQSLSSAIVQIVYKRNSVLNRVLGETSTFNIEIRDYPGEWLLDLPLIGQNYLNWCFDQTDLAKQVVRKHLLGDFFQQLQDINPFDVLDDAQIKQIHQQFKHYLKQCKDEGLTLIQPGRMLLEDNYNESLPFFPLLGLHNYDRETLISADDNSVYKVMSQRYQDYIEKIVKPFNKHFFDDIDRQVVLIDALKVISGGQDNFEDMMLAQSRIMDCYKYGSSNALQKLFNTKIERILFLASKPDRVLASQHENLRSLVNDIIVRTCSQKLRNSIDIDTESACSIRCTQEINDLLRVTNAAGQRGVVDPIPIPDHIPTTTEWAELKHWIPETLQPPEIEGLANGARLPSIRMDKVLTFLLGDKF